MEAEFHRPPPAEPADLPCGWEAVYDPSQGRHYYECPATGQRTWRRQDRNLRPEPQAALAFIADTYLLRPHVASSTGGHRGGKPLPHHDMDHSLPSVQDLLVVAPRCEFHRRTPRRQVPARHEESLREALA